MKSWSTNSALILCVIFSGLFMGVMMLLSSSHNFFFILELNLFELSLMPVSLVLLLDFWSCLFFFTVLLISMSVFTFSQSYMMFESHFVRFHVILMIFVFSMVLLIFSPGFFSLFLGWDGLGLSSFLLVIYYQNSKSMNAGLLTFMTNRLGDGLLLVGASLGLISMNFNIVLSKGLYDFSGVFLILFVLGTLTKSAQIPFSAWLPAAMAAPTPVSSLVHSSTLVTAGVYVLFRTSHLLSAPLLMFLLFSGVMTMLMASLSALAETDMKKIVALSTLSQLGLMVTALGLGFPVLSFFHLITHAYFKALMFIAVGTIMHSAESYQELKVMGSSTIFPIIIGVILGANFSLCGLPFFSGFFSKEMIIQISLNSSFQSLMLYGVFIWSIILTQLYSFRFMCKVFFFSFNYFSLMNFNSEDKWTVLSFSYLILPACFSGSALSSILGIKLGFMLDPWLLKIFVVSLVFYSAWQASVDLNKVNSLPSMWHKWNLWFLPIFSGQIFSLSFNEGDRSHKVVCAGMTESSLTYLFKLFSTKMFLSFHWFPENMFKFTALLVMLGLLILF